MRKNKIGIFSMPVLMIGLSTSVILNNNWTTRHDTNSNRQQNISSKYELNNNNTIRGANKSQDNTLATDKVLVDTLSQKPIFSIVHGAVDKSVLPSVASDNINKFQSTFVTKDHVKFKIITSGYDESEKLSYEVTLVSKGDVIRQDLSGLGGIIFWDEWNDVGPSIDQAWVDALSSTTVYEMINSIISKVVLPSVASKNINESQNTFITKDDVTFKVVAFTNDELGNLSYDVVSVTKGTAVRENLFELSGKIFWNMNVEFPLDENMATDAINQWITKENNRETNGLENFIEKEIRPIFGTSQLPYPDPGEHWMIISVLLNHINPQILSDSKKEISQIKDSIYGPINYPYWNGATNPDKPNSFGWKYEVKLNIRTFSNLLLSFNMGGLFPKWVEWDVYYDIPVIITVEQELDVTKPDNTTLNLLDIVWSQ